MLVLPSDSLGPLFATMPLSCHFWMCLSQSCLLIEHSLAQELDPGPKFETCWALASSLWHQQGHQKLYVQENRVADVVAKCHHAGAHNVMGSYPGFDVTNNEEVKRKYWHCCYIIRTQFNSLQRVIFSTYLFLRAFWSWEIHLHCRWMFSCEVCGWRIRIFCTYPERQCKYITCSIFCVR